MGVARLYSFGTPYNDVELPTLNYEQTADRMYYAHPDKPVQKLTRSGHTSWLFEQVTFGPTITAPTTVTGTATDPEQTDWNPVTDSYVVTAIDDDTGQESRASTSVGTALNDLTLDGNFNTVSWTAVTGAGFYNVYKENNGVYGYIGGTEGLSFVDDNIIADLSNTPPKAENPFDGADNYPSALTFHEGRLWFGRTNNLPNGLWSSQSSDFENLDRSRPAKADEAIAQTLVGRRVNAINQLISSTSLIALTSDGVYSIVGTEDNVLTPTGSFLPRKPIARGASKLRPIDVDNVVFFRPLQGSRIRALNYSLEFDGLVSNDITIFSPHFFEGDRIISWAFQTEPYSCVWAVMLSGRLLCFTWEAEQQVWGWTQQESEGAFFEDVEVITEGRYDRAYFLVRRTIGGVTKRYYERMALPHDADYTQACHLDSSVTVVNDTASATVGGLFHLEGETVCAFADGYEYQGLIVENGQVELPRAHTRVSVGIPFTAEIETLPNVLNTQSGTLHTQRQTYSYVDIRVQDTRGAELSVNEGPWEEIDTTTEDEDPTGIRGLGVKTVPVSVEAEWNEGATIRVRQQRCMPMRILGMFPRPLVDTDGY